MLLAYLKMLGVYHIKRNKKSGPFLSGGKYYGVKKPQENLRDSLFLRTNSSRKIWKKLTKFDEFSIVTTNSFLAPQDLAAYIFKGVGDDPNKNNTPLITLKHHFTAWKKTNKLPYITIKDIYGSEGGGEFGGGSSGSRHKKLTKQAFIDQLTKLAGSLETLNQALRDENIALATQRLQGDMTNRF